MGTTSAAPAVVDGARLPYTASGRQLVLLRHTEASGWQIADVLRDADGSAFAQNASATEQPQLAGAMTKSGEAWIALRRQGQIAVFHRQRAVAGGQFRLDQNATTAIGPYLAGFGADTRLSLRLDGADRAFGLVVNPSRSARTITVPAPSGGDGVQIEAQLDYAVLQDGRWRLQTVAPLPPSYDPQTRDRVALKVADASGPGVGWGALEVDNRALALMLGRFEAGIWTWVEPKLNALDLTDPIGSTTTKVVPTALRADSGGVWIGASVRRESVDVGGSVVAFYDSARADTTRSWCANLPEIAGCGAPLDIVHPATVPDAVFDTARGKVAFGVSTGSSSNFVNVFARGDWTAAPSEGFSSGLFTAPGEGWLTSTSTSFGRVTPAATPDPLARWPQANRSTLLSVALPQGSAGAVADPGALAVGLDGSALRYDAAAGWLVEPTPSRAARLALRGVAFVDARRAVAVGQSGIILNWDGTSWQEDPRSVQATRTDLTAVAFGAGGDGWAVGRFGTILHYDAGAWTTEEPPPEDSGVTLTSVTVAGSDVYAVAGGNLIRRGAGGAWSRVGAAELPAGFERFEGDLRLVSGLPDGGIVAGGRSLVLKRPGPSARFEHAEQPLEGIAVALDAFRDDAGRLRAFVALSPEVSGAGELGFPAADGELLRETSDGWEDLSRAQPVGSAEGGDGRVKADPVLAVDASADGARAWAVGGYAGTRSAEGLGTDEILAVRAPGWRTAQLWRYDRGASARSPAVTQTAVSLPAQEKTVNFAYFSSISCRVQCSAIRDAQPDVNLTNAASQIAKFAEQPGGPAFAVLGGDARGPIDDTSLLNGNGAQDFPRLPSLLAPLGGLALFAVFGQRDAVPGQPEPAQPWADAFAQAPAPFGTRPVPEGIAPAGQGSRVGAVHRYYAFDASQNGGRLRVIVLDISGGSLEESSPGQAGWLQDRLDGARGAGLPVVVMVGRALAGFGSDDDLARELVGAGVLAVFAAGDNNDRALIPAPPAAERIPQYVGASLGYQRTRNNGVVWYSVSVNTDARTIDVQGIPIVESLALKPLRGLAAARSSTLTFEAVGRRAPSSLATTPANPTIPGFDQYVSIPAVACGSSCIRPSYRFESADSTIGEFVEPTGTGSRLPRLDVAGRPIPSFTSGLFCAYNAGTTTVSVTVGLIKASLPVTIQPGGFGRPCGTVPRLGQSAVITRPIPGRPRAPQAPSTPRVGAPPPTPVTNDTPQPLPSFTPPLAPPAQPQPPAPKSAPPPPAPPPAPPPPPGATPDVPTLTPLGGVQVVAVPPLPSAAQPVPPGGSASAQAAARRKEKAHKQAQQSAFTVRRADVPADAWFIGGAGLTTVLTLMLLATSIGARPGPRRRTALAVNRTPPPLHRGTYSRGSH